MTTIEILTAQLEAVRQQLEAAKKEEVLSQLSSEAKAIIQNIHTQVECTDQIAFLDNHSNKIDFGRGYILLQKGNEVSVCAVPKSDRFCLNPFGLSGKKLYLSTWSVGGNIDLSEFNRDLDQIKAYYNKISTSKIVDIVIFNV
jgi:hypothetical protein